ncbi:MAG TPA: phosphatidate cytidylyltransferase [Candidatus Limnocylindria bacterium]|nr:phosphatidate cytidylyltransferase [Candidatus Limnocylindria bacterium]
MRPARPRLRTAFVYGAVVLAAVLAPPIVFALLAAVLLVLGGREIVRLCGDDARLFALASLGLVAGLFALVVLRDAGPAFVHHAAAGELPVWLLLAILPTWAADIVAYAAGTRWGRRRIAPHLSPGKTWEGTIAGFGAAAITVLGVAALFGLPRLPSALAAVAIGPVGLLGDLAESALKRRAGVKDSGTLLPGHGGVLDRIDSLLAAGVLVSLLLWLAERLG